MKNLFLVILLCLLAPNVFADRTGTILGAGATVGDSDNTFASAYCDEINGCNHWVADITARNAITTARRVAGLEIGTLSDGKKYRLGAGLTNSDWSEISATDSVGWTQSGTNIYTTTSTDNVGVGTSLPVTKFQVKGGDTTVDALRFIGSGSSGNFSSSGGFLFDPSNASYITPRFVIGTDGNVGIGTITPQQLFHVNDAAIIGSTVIGTTGEFIASVDAKIDLDDPVESGSIRFSSVGLSNNEALDIGFSAPNQIKVSSPTLATNIKFDNIAISTPQLLVGGAQYPGSGTWDVSTAIVADYRMEDNAGSTVVVDQTGNFNGTGGQNTTAFTTTGKLSNGFDFNAASTDTIDLGSGVNQTSGYSIELWMSTTTTATSDIAGNRSGSGDDIGWHMTLNSTGTRAIWRIDSGSAVNSCTNITTVNTGTFRHYVGVYDGSSINFYVNAVPECTFAQVGGLVSGDTGTLAGNTFIGKSPKSPTAYFNGKIDNFRIYNRALTQVEVTGLYNAGVGTIDYSNGSVGDASRVNTVGTSSTVLSQYGLDSAADLLIEGSQEIKTNQFVNGNGYFGGNVGIGTLDPSVPLKVNGGVIAENLAVGASTIPGGSFDMASATVTNIQMEDNAANTTVTETNGSNSCSSTANTSTLTTIGKIGNGFSFPGSELLQCTGSALKITGDITVVAWGKTSVTGAQDIMGNRISTGLNNGWKLFQTSANKLEFLVDTDQGVQNVVSTTSINTNAFQLWVGRRQGTSLSVSVNNAWEGTPTGSIPGDMGTNAGNLQIGHVPSTSGYFTGVLDNVMIFNRYLTDTEITELFNGGSGTNNLSSSSPKFSITGDGTTTGVAMEVFNGADAPTLIFLDNGNLGIGTLTPQQKLHTLGTIQATAFVGDGSALTGISGGGSKWVSGAVGINTTSPVGIGTVAPISALQVVGTVNATAFVGDGSGLSGISAGGWTDGGANVFLTNTTDNVGIGTLNPTSLLTVRGATAGSARFINSSASSSGAGAGFTIVSDDNAALVSGDRYGLVAFGGSADTADTLVLGAAITAYAEGTLSASSAPSNIRLETAPSGSATRITRMTINSSGNVGLGTINPIAGLSVMNGNVGIGTWNPLEMLQINGTVRSTGYKSSDGTSGVTVTTCTGFKDGLCISGT